ncbi:hypothetical protein BJ742DRAFT_687018 [Cladochytrium replicatum]|nr:hypothetical protein BJ742DRAFT_687018 [Cladochytrium replicatum]
MPSDSEKSKRRREEQNLRALRDLLDLPENRHCADCGDPAPQWASVNIGCFLCQRCAGMHRQLGTHISRVKSITLDTWTEEWLEAST